jgi:hypothetical protein
MRDPGQAAFKLWSKPGRLARFMLTVLGGMGARDSREEIPHGYI